MCCRRLDSSAFDWLDAAVNFQLGRTVGALVLAGCFFGAGYLVDYNDNKQAIFDILHQDWLLLAGTCTVVFVLGMVAAAVYTGILHALSALSFIPGLLPALFFAAAVVPTIPYLSLGVMWVQYDDWPLFLEPSSHLDDLFLFIFLLAVMAAVRAVWLRYILKAIILKELKALSKATASAKVFMYKLSRAVSPTSSVLLSDKLLAAGGTGAQLSPLGNLPARVVELESFVASAASTSSLKEVPIIRSRGFYVDSTLAKSVLHGSGFPRTPSKPAKELAEQVFEVRSTKQMVAIAEAMFDRLALAIGVESEGAQLMRNGGVQLTAGTPKGEAPALPRPPRPPMRFVSRAAVAREESKADDTTPLAGRPSRVPSLASIVTSGTGAPSPRPTRDAATAAAVHSVSHSVLGAMTRMGAVGGVAGSAVTAVMTAMAAKNDTARSVLLGAAPPPTEDEMFAVATYLHGTDLKLLAGEAGEAAVAACDPNNDLRVTRSEFVQGAQTMMRQWKSLSRHWYGKTQVSRALGLSSAAVFLFASGIVFLLVFGVSLTDVLLPLGTVAVAVSFALGGAITDTVRALVFLIGMKPYELEDRVNVPGVNNGSTVYVHKIDLLTTTFRAVSGQMSQVSNSWLASQVIVNQHRSTSVTFEVKFHVGLSTTSNQLQQVAQCAKVYLRSRPLRWRTDCDVIIDGVMPKPADRLTFSIWVTHLFGWQDGGIIWGDRGRFILAMVRCFERLGIKWTLPTQPVTVSGPGWCPAGEEAKETSG